MLHLIKTIAMAKVKLSRPHNGSEKGDSIEVTSEQKNYFERVGLTEKEEKTKPKTKELKTNLKTK